MRAVQLARRQKDQPSGTGDGASASVNIVGSENMARFAVQLLPAKRLPERKCRIFAVRDDPGIHLPLGPIGESAGRCRDSAMITGQKKMPPKRGWCASEAFGASHVRSKVRQRCHRRGRHPLNARLRPLGSQIMPVIFPLKRRG